MTEKRIENCYEHSGCIARINGLEKSESEQWESISHMRERIDKVYNKLNVILVSVILAALGLAGNLAYELLKH